MALTTDQSLAYRNLASGEPIDKAREWLASARLQNEEGIGWPHLTAQSMPTVWGGTLDAIIGLSKAGLDRFNPIIDDALEWLFEQQHEDGGFGSREVTYSAAEATAWVLIMLSEIGYDRRACPKCQKAIQYLEACVVDGGGVATSPGEEPRTYASAFALLALHEHSDKASSVASALRVWGHADIGGWGIRPGATPVPTLTAQVVYVLVTTGFLSSRDEICKKALTFIVESSEQHGLGKNYVETWYSKLQPNVPVSCSSHFSSWALRAYIACGYEVGGAVVAGAIEYLVSGQRDGVWYYDSLDDEKHIWCVAGVVWALVDAREALLPKVFDLANANALEHYESISVTFGDHVRSGVARSLTLFRENLIYLAVSFLILWTFRNFIGIVFSTLTNFLRVERDNLFVEVLGSFFWFVLFAGGAYLIRLVSKGAGLRKDRGS